MRNYKFATVLKNGEELDEYEVQAEDVLEAMLTYKYAIEHEVGLFISYKAMQEATIEESYYEGGLDYPEASTDVLLMRAEDWNGKMETLCVTMTESMTEIAAEA